MKKLKKVIWLIIGLIIGISTTVGAATIFRSQDITYSSSATTKTNVKDSLDELYSKANTPWSCAEGFICTRPFSIVNVGDYISMIPENVFYDTNKNITGFTENQHFWVQDLRLWRVIKKNDDGTVDAVSEYVSDYEMYFVGELGYKNYIGALNEIAAQYTNSKYVQSTRHMGYSNQEEYCTSLSSCKADSSTAWDVMLVNSIYGSLKATHSDGSTAKYWVASRVDERDNNGPKYGLSIMEDGGWGSGILLTNKGYTYTPYPSRGIRPIVTFKSDIQIQSGDGKSISTAYQLY